MYVQELNICRLGASRYCKMVHTLYINVPKYLRDVAHTVKKATKEK